MKLKIISKNVFILDDNIDSIPPNNILFYDNNCFSNG